MSNWNKYIYLFILNLGVGNIKIYKIKNKMIKNNCLLFKLPIPNFPISLQKLISLLHLLEQHRKGLPSRGASDLLNLLSLFYNSTLNSVWKEEHGVL